MNQKLIKEAVSKINNEYVKSLLMAALKVDGMLATPQAIWNLANYIVELEEKVNG